MFLLAFVLSFSKPALPVAPAPCSQQLPIQPIERLRIAQTTTIPKIPITFTPSNPSQYLDGANKVVPFYRGGKLAGFRLNWKISFIIEAISLFLQRSRELQDQQCELDKLKNFDYVDFKFHPVYPYRCTQYSMTAIMFRTAYKYVPNPDNPLLESTDRYCTAGVTIGCILVEDPSSLVVRTNDPLLISSNEGMISIYGSVDLPPYREDRSLGNLANSGFVRCNLPTDSSCFVFSGAACSLSLRFSRSSPPPSCGTPDFDLTCSCPKIDKIKIVFNNPMYPRGAKIRIVTCSPELVAAMRSAGCGRVVDPNGVEIP